MKYIDEGAKKVYTIMECDPNHETYMFFYIFILQFNT